MEIKAEYIDSEALCRGCLSLGRNLLPLGSYGEIYNKITFDFQYCPSNENEALLCWECFAHLKRILKFQHQVRRANEILWLGQTYVYGTLSNLTTVILNDTQIHTVYVNLQTNTQDVKKTENIIHDEKPEETTLNENKFLENEIVYDNDEDETSFGLEQITDEREIEYVSNVQINETKPRKRAKYENKWFKKRALLNKKPKFKIFTNSELKHDEIFRKVEITEKELAELLKRERENEYYKSKKYKCEKCVIGFSKKQLFDEHVRSRHNLNHQFICKICEVHFQGEQDLSRHTDSHYFVYECTICNYSGTKYSRHMHIDQAHRVVWQCLKCHLKFVNRNDFDSHFKDSHEKFICHHCGISFKMRYSIKNHITKKHSPMKCKFCSKTFTRYNSLWLHKKLCHTSTKTPAYCVECDKRYVDIHRYRWHLANSVRHRAKKSVRIPCPSCDKVFSKKIYMKDHYDLVHLNNYKYRCEECDKNFTRNADLVKHRRRLHEGILPPKNKICPICGRAFTTNKILTNHLRTHTGERPYTCPATFTQASARASHFTVVHHIK